MKDIIQINIKKEEHEKECNQEKEKLGKDID